MMTDEEDKKLTPDEEIKIDACIDLLFELSLDIVRADTKKAQEESNDSSTEKPE